MLAFTPGGAPLTARRGVQDRAPVMADVAQLAGVSHQTVSRVINDHPGVSPATRRRVERAIGQLGYRRNTAAHALVTKRSRTLGVVGVNTSYFGPASTLSGIEHAARIGGYFVQFVSLRDVDQDNMRAAVAFLMDANVDGIIVIAPLRTAVDAVGGLTLNVPLIRVASDRCSTPTSVSVDHGGGAREATRHLLQLGHRTVAHIRGPHDWLDADAREAGWRAEMSAARAAAPEPYVGDWTAASGYQAGRWLTHLPDVTAVFVANDQMALGLIRALSEAGRRLPDDMSVVGFDDIPEAGYFLPPLTTVRQDFVTLGQVCIARLLALIAGDDATAVAPVQTTLVIRSSAIAPPR